MTKQEIKAAIAEGIAGQGTNVDAGGVLPKILGAIVDALPEQKGYLTIPGEIVDADLSKTAFAQRLGITTEELDALMRGEYAGIIYNGSPSGENVNRGVYAFAYAKSYIASDEEAVDAIFGVLVNGIFESVISLYGNVSEDLWGGVVESSE